MPLADKGMDVRVLCTCGHTWCGECGDETDGVPTPSADSSGLSESQPSSELSAVKELSWSEVVKQGERGKLAGHESVGTCHSS